MQKIKNALFYILTLSIAVVVISIVIRSSPAAPAPAGTVAEDKGLTEALLKGVHTPLTLLLLQIAAILTVGRVSGWLFRKMGQPAVIGEMAAGILLGASFLGHYFPGISAYLFNGSSVQVLNLLSQIGLVLFMFIVGLELDFALLRSKAGTSLMISHASIVAPFTLGVIAAYFTFGAFAPAGIRFVPYALFIGISMSITAFPVLARIIQERRLTGTSLGTIAIACAAADDVTAWCILAVVIAIVKAGSVAAAVLTIALAIAYVGIMFLLVKPALKRFIKAKDADTNAIPVCLIVMIASAFLSDAIGIHALFGAFVAGVVMPANPGFRAKFIDKVESVALSLLLPLFFVTTGLKTKVWSLDNSEMWLLCGILILLAILGKFGAASLTARFSGLAWMESFKLGALMNTRGLTELVVLNVGYDLGVITTPMFTMLVMMAFVTTLMTGPLLSLFNRLESVGDRKSGAGS